MVLPGNLAMVHVTGTRIDWTGRPMTGTVTFMPSLTADDPLVDPDANVVIMPSDTTVLLDENGAFTVDLPATDAPNVRPIGWTYRVNESLADPDGESAWRGYDISLPAEPGTVDLADVARMLPADPAGTGAAARSGGTDTLRAALHDLETYRTQTPSLEELICTMTIPAWNGASELGASTVMSLMVAPFTLRILSFAISFDYAHIDTDDTDYWEFTLRTYPVGGGRSTTLATRTTQPTGANGGGAITQRSGWWFTNLDVRLDAGELLALGTAVEGAAGPISLPITCTLRYAPATS